MKRTTIKIEVTPEENELVKEAAYRARMSARGWIVRTALKAASEQTGLPIPTANDDGTREHEPLKQ